MYRNYSAKILVNAMQYNKATTFADDQVVLSNFSPHTFTGAKPNFAGTAYESINHQSFPALTNSLQHLRFIGPSNVCRQESSASFAVTILRRNNSKLLKQRGAFSLRGL